MKLILRGILALFVAMMPFVAVGGPQIKWVATTHDFGAFDEELGMVSWNFVFTNEGDEPLVVTGVRATCGCTTPHIDNKVVAPGDTSSIHVTYNPEGRPGRFTKYVYVDANTNPERSTLKICGTVIGASNSVKSRYPVDMGPLKLRRGAVMIGRVKKGHVKTEFLDGYNRSSDTIRPVVVDMPPYIDVVMMPTDVPPGEQVSFNFYFKSDRCRMWDIVSDSVTVVPDLRSGDTERYTLPIVAIVEEDFFGMTPSQLEKAPKLKLSDDKVDFGNVSDTDSPQTRTIVITNKGKSTMEIRRVYTTDPGVSVKCNSKSLKNGKSCPIEITVDPREIKGKMLNSRITIVTNSPDSPVTTIRVVGY